MRNIGGALLFMVVATSSANATQQCLAVRDIASFSQGGRSGVQVTTFDNRLYNVTFRGLCAHNLNSHFIYEQWQLGRCLSHNDTLRMNTGGACVVEAVREVPSHRPPGSGRGAPEAF
jgi:hypothetical protein